MPAGALGESPASRSPKLFGVNTAATSACASVTAHSPVALGNQGGPARVSPSNCGASAAAAAATSPVAPTSAFGDGRIYQHEGQVGSADDKRGHGHLKSNSFQEAARAGQGERGGGGGAGHGQHKGRNAEVEGDSWGSGNVGRDYSKEGSFESSGWPLSRVPSNVSNEEKSVIGESNRTRDSLEFSRAGSGCATSRGPSPEEAASLRNLQSTFRPLRLSPMR